MDGGNAKGLYGTILAMHVTLTLLISYYCYFLVHHIFKFQDLGQGIQEYPCWFEEAVDDLSDYYLLTDLDILNL